MSTKKNYAESGVKSDNETAKEVSYASRSKNLNTVKINDAYRKYMENPPTDRRPMTFLEFKSHYIIVNRNKYKKNNKKNIKKGKKADKTLRKYHKEYEVYVSSCKEDKITPMHYDKWKSNFREQDPSLERWTNSRTAPSLWEKRDRDPAYAATMRDSLSTTWGIGKPRGPKNS